MNGIDVDKIDIKQFRYGDHKISTFEYGIPETISTRFIVGCHECRSSCSVSILLCNLITNPILRSGIPKRLFNQFKRDIVKSCFEAKQLGIINLIHTL
jgi:hypothetical protein